MIKVILKVVFMKNVIVECKLGKMFLMEVLILDEKEIMLYILKGLIIC